MDDVAEGLTNISSTSTVLRVMGLRHENLEFCANRFSVLLLLCISRIVLISVKLPEMIGYIIILFLESICCLISMLTTTLSQVNKFFVID